MALWLWPIFSGSITMQIAWPMVYGPARGMVHGLFIANGPWPNGLWPCPWPDAYCIRPMAYGPYGLWPKARSPIAHRPLPMGILPPLWPDALWPDALWSDAFGPWAMGHGL